MSLIFQVSDTHFGTEQPPVVEALLKLGHQLSPDLTVFSGDITQRARRAQFRAARQFVDRLAVRSILVLPGNHDIPLFNIFARVFYPYANHQRVFGSDLEPAFESADLLVIGVNTTRASRHVDGEVSPEQITRVAARLRRADARQLRIVVTHQPVHVPRKSEEKNLLHGHRAAVREWAAAGADLVMGGHIHLPYVRPLRELIDDLPRSVWIVQAGTALSTRVRYDAPNSVNVVRYGSSEQARTCRVERWDYGSFSGSFELVDSVDIALDRAERCAARETVQKLD
jgi:3',5'-cyclic AMP phosphodiesterase CpdA